MPIKFIDTSVFQPAYRNYYVNLRRQGVRFNFVKLTEGNWYKNPSADLQIKNSLSVFGSAGVYHYWHGENANYFLYWFKRTGLNPATTKFALDVEETTLPYYLAGYINRYFKQLVDYGFKPGNLWVYTNEAQFLNTGRIIVKHLKYGFVWAAKYPTMSESYNLTLGPWSSFRPSANAWQFNGTGQDESFDYTGTLGSSQSPTRSKRRKKVPPKKAKPVNHYVRSGRHFQAITDVGGHDDLSFRKPNGNLYKKGSKFRGRLVKYYGITRLLTADGYFTSNTKYLKAIK